MKNFVFIAAIVLLFGAGAFVALNRGPARPAVSPPPPAKSETLYNGSGGPISTGHTLPEVVSCAADYLRSSGREVDSVGRHIDREALDKFIPSFVLAKNYNFEDEQGFRKACVEGAEYAYDIIEGNDRVGESLQRQ